MPSTNSIFIATRGSALALAQAKFGPGAMPGSFSKAHL